MLPANIVLKNTKLTPLQQRTALKAAGIHEQVTDETILSQTQCMVFWVYLLLVRLKFLDTDQRNLLYEELIPYVSKMEYDESANIPMLAIADGRYALWTGKTGWLDLVEGLRVNKLPHTPLETLAFNLREMFNRNLAICMETANRKESDNGEQE